MSLNMVAAIRTMIAFVFRLIMPTGSCVSFLNTILFTNNEGQCPSQKMYRHEMMKKPERIKINICLNGNYWQKRGTKPKWHFVQ